MDEKKMRDLRLKMKDYKNYSMVLLMMSAFLSIGSVIPSVGTTDRNQIILSMAGVVFIAASVFFYKKVAKLKDQLQNEEL